MDYRQYTVSRRSKQPLLDFILQSLKHSGCRILKVSEANLAPFRITFEDPSGVKQGIIVYAFLANSKATKNRPDDEHRFQVKYSKKDGLLHTIWQDPYQLYTTLMVGIDLEREMFVAIDPMLHQLTKLFISVEFKRAEVEAVLDKGWHCWERSKRRDDDTPVETMVGGRVENFLEYVRFEQAARGLDQGHRYLLAENMHKYGDGIVIGAGPVIQPRLPDEAVHVLATEFEIPEDEILNMIQAAPRLKMAVRGWVAERHLEKLLVETPGVDDCIQLEEDGRPDFEVVYQGSAPILIECKNVLRKTMADGTVRIDFQKTRGSKDDPCTRFYRPTEFQILAACLHPCSEVWDFSFKLTSDLDPHKNCPDRLSNLVRISDDWTSDVESILQRSIA